MNTDTQKAIAEQYLKYPNKPVRLIAEEFGVSVATLFGVLRDLGIPRRGTRRTVDVGVILKDYQDGKDVRVIAEEQGCTRQHVYVILRENGITTSPGRGRRNQMTPQRAGLIELARTLYTSGESISDIAKRIGWDYYKTRDAIRPVLGQMTEEEYAFTQTDEGRLSLIADLLVETCVNLKLKVPEIQEKRNQLYGQVKKLKLRVAEGEVTGSLVLTQLKQELEAANDAVLEFNNWLIEQAKVLAKISVETSS